MYLGTFVSRAKKLHVLKNSLFLVIFAAATHVHVHAQAKPTATRFASGQIGASYVNAYADYTESRFNGYGAYADLDFHHGLGVEAEYHYFTDADSNYLIYERTYEFGARYSRTYGRFKPYGKLMVGRGVFNFLSSNYGYNLYAGAGGVDIAVRPSINVRLEYELQQWLPGSGSGQTLIPNGLSPNLPTVGVAYRFK